LRYDRFILGTSRSNQHDSIRRIAFRSSKSNCFHGEEGIKRIPYDEIINYVVHSMDHFFAGVSLKK